MPIFDKWYFDWKDCNKYLFVFVVGICQFPRDQAFPTFSNKSQLSLCGHQSLKTFQASPLLKTLCPC